MLILGIETSCDETAVAVVRDGRDVLSNVIASQHDLHAEFAGVVPEIASRAHVERFIPVLRAALTEAGITRSDVDAVAVGHRPGLIGSLLTGVGAAKALAWSLGVPLIGVDHIHAHLYAGTLDSTEPAFPALGLAVSGGHTSLYALDSWLSLTRLGATIDDAIGEAYDKAATILGLPYPGGPHLDQLAAQRRSDDEPHTFPVSLLGKESLDFSFSGLKTSLLYAVRGQPIGRGRRPTFERDHTALSADQKRCMAIGFQHAAVRAVTVKVSRALDHADDRPFRTLLVGGGVSANSHLRSELTALAKSRNLDLRLPPLTHCMDNAAMIAGLGYRLHQAGRTADLSLTAVPTAQC
ncbi:MAG: tRNA (adenosine(37)-N6)-threonylcarbamoyltransferase complex transferase subunit TsaD [Phycisphaerales bacterium]|nr:tRNA (adenosine(37)-N6)-threonylcarbamoyltransferase complex transferase subunit TsaD [Phycisphaerales bacterium]